MKALDEQEIVSQLQKCNLWRREGQMIRRIFLFPAFMDSIKFVNAVAEHAERANHHPDIGIEYNRVTLGLSTHDANGLTERDFSFAQFADSLFASW